MRWYLNGYLSDFSTYFAYDGTVSAWPDTIDLWHVSHGEYAIIGTVQQSIDKHGIRCVARPAFTGAFQFTQVSYGGVIDRYFVTIQGPKPQGPIARTMEP